MELVIDTNIYRNLVRGLNDSQVAEFANAIDQSAKRKGIQIPFPINSAMELISHFNDENESDKIECRKAIQLLVRLSTEKSSEGLTGDMIPPLNAVLGQYFFKEDNQQARMYGVVIQIANVLVGNLNSESEEAIRQNVEAVRVQIELEKQQIRDNYEDYLKTMNNGKADWAYFKEKEQLRKNYFKRLHQGEFSVLVAQSFADRAYRISRKPINKDQAYLNTIKQFMQDFCPALIMNELLLRGIGDSVTAMERVADKRWNTILDVSLIFGALFNPRNIDKRIVTEEKNIILAYRDCGFQNKILNLAQFKTLLGI